MEAIIERIRGRDERLGTPGRVSQGPRASPQSIRDKPAQPWKAHSWTRVGFSAIRSGPKAISGYSCSWASQGML